MCKLRGVENFLVLQEHPEKGLLKNGASLLRSNLGDLASVCVDCLGFDLQYISYVLEGHISAIIFSKVLLSTPNRVFVNRR